MKRIRRFRRTVVRGGRSYVVCGLPARVAARATGANAFVLIPGASLVLAMLCSVVISQLPRQYGPAAANSSALAGGIASRYTIDDFIFASR
jgi:hypothetical protein